MIGLISRRHPLWPSTQTFYLVTEPSSSRESHLSTAVGDICRSKHFPHLLPLWVLVNRSAGLDPNNPELSTTLVDHYSLDVHWFHCIINNTYNTGFLKTRIPEYCRIDTGGDTDLESSTSKVISIPSAPLLPFI